MDTSVAIILGATLVIGGSVVGIFVTKTKGFGKFTTAVLVLTLVLYLAALAFATQKIEMVSLVNLLFAVAGYAGGLLTADDKSQKCEVILKRENKTEPPSSQSP